MKIPGELNFSSYNAVFEWFMVYGAWMKIHTQHLIGYFQNPNNIRKPHHRLQVLRVVVSI